MYGHNVETPMTAFDPEEGEKIPFFRVKKDYKLKVELNTGEVIEGVAGCRPFTAKTYEGNEIFKLRPRVTYDTLFYFWPTSKEREIPDVMEVLERNTRAVTYLCRIEKKRKKASASTRGPKALQPILL